MGSPGGGTQPPAATLLLCHLLGMFVPIRQKLSPTPVLRPGQGSVDLRGVRVWIASLHAPPPTSKNSHMTIPKKAVESALAAMRPPEALGRAFNPKRKKGEPCVLPSPHPTLLLNLLTLTSHHVILGLHPRLLPGRSSPPPLCYPPAWATVTEHHRLRA